MDKPRIERHGNATEVYRDDELVGEIHRTKDNRFAYTSHEAIAAKRHGVASSERAALAHIGYRLVNNANLSK